MLVPEVAAGAAAELADLRAACDAAVGRLRAVGPDVLVLVGTGAETAWQAPDEYGSLRPWGYPMDVVLGGRGRAGLPLSLTIGAWLLSREPGGAAPVAPAAVVAAGVVAAGVVPATVVAATVGADEKPAACAAFGREVAARGARVALLALGDGSAVRAARAREHADPRAEPYDAAVVRALGTADLDALLALDPAEAAELMAAGRPAWQVLAGAAAGTAWQAELLYDHAPYGVSYTVASWSAA
jgi:hypothetical protein